LVTALLQRTSPEGLDVYTTPVTYALDLAVITPAAALAGLLVRRRDPLGYLLAAPLLVIIVLLLPTITLSTILQAAAGVPFTAAQVAGPIAGFGILGGVGSWLVVRLLRAMPTTASAPNAEPADVDVPATTATPGLSPVEVGFDVPPGR
jgi:hypothetical protein